MNIVRRFFYKIIRSDIYSPYIDLENMLEDDPYYFSHFFNSGFGKRDYKELKKYTMSKYKGGTGVNKCGVKQLKETTCAICFELYQEKDNILN